MFRRIKRLAPGQQISCAEMNRALDMVERSSRITVNPASPLRLSVSAAGYHFDFAETLQVGDGITTALGVSTITFAGPLPSVVTDSSGSVTVTIDSADDDTNATTWNVTNVYNIYPYGPTLVVNEHGTPSLVFYPDDGTGNVWCLPFSRCAGSGSGSTSGSGSGAGSTLKAPCPPTISKVTGWTSGGTDNGYMAFGLSPTVTAGAMAYVVLAYSGAYTSYTPPAGWTRYLLYDGSSTDCMTVEIYYHLMTATDPSTVTFNTGYATMGWRFSVRGGGVPENHTVTTASGPNPTALGLTVPGADRLLLAIYAQDKAGALAAPTGMSTGISATTAGTPAENLTVFWEAVNAGATGDILAAGGGNLCITSLLVSIPVTCADTTSGQSGGGGGSGPVGTVCGCADIPGTLFATLTNVSGCACLAGTYTLTYDAGSSSWVFSGSGCSSSSLVLRLQCLLGAWTLSVTCGGIGPNTTPTSTQCSPFSQSYATLTVPSGCCSGSVNVSITQ